MAGRVMSMKACFWCKSNVPHVAKDVSAVLCGNCVQRLTGAPEMPKVIPRLSYEERKAKKLAKAAKKAAKLEALKTAKGRSKGRGWHLKKLFEYDGQFYSFGQPIDARAADNLKKSIQREEAAKLSNPMVPKRRGRPPKVRAA